MRVACPNCAAEYDLPPAVVSRLGGGRTVRCTRCGNAWAPDPPAPATPPEPAAPPSVAEAPPPPPIAVPPPPVPPPASPSAAPEPARPGARARSVVPLLWLLSVLVLAGAAWAAWHWRVEIVAVWPAAARAYMALGLAR